MALTLEEANRIVAGAIAKAQELNIKISVAVCDAGGRLVAFNRMDAALWAGVYGSQGKAVASAAGFARPSGALQQMADSPIVRGIVAAEGGHMILINRLKRDFPGARETIRLLDQVNLMTPENIRIPARGALRSCALGSLQAGAGLVGGLVSRTRSVRRPGQTCSSLARGSPQNFPCGRTRCR